MKKIAKFEKISFANFVESYPEMDKEDYDRLKLPSRATKGSAGYDFFAPKNIEIKSGETITIPTGIRVKIKDGWVLQVYPRSGLGFKYRLQLNNTVGIIDSDYYYSDNEGHIYIKMTNANTNDKTVSIKKGEAFAQGIFVEYGITEDDEVSNVRNGGFGSTNK